MAIARVQGPTSNTGASPTTVSFASNPTTGNLMVAIARTFTGGASTNGSIPGWTRATGMRAGSSAYGGVWYKVVGAGESKDVVLTWTGSSETAMVIEEWGGFTGTPTLDKIANTDYTSAAKSQTSGTCATTTAAAELCIAFFSMGSTAVTATWSNSFALEVTNAPTYNFYLGSRVAAATWAAETTITWTDTARVCGGLIATFMGVSATILNISVSDGDTVYD